MARLRKRPRDGTLYFAGFEPPGESRGNGERKAEATAERKVPHELEIELNIRKWHPSMNYSGKWFNTIHHGDNLITLGKMPDESVDLILTDPPYNINYTSQRRVKKPKFKQLQNDDNGAWIPRFAAEMFRVLKNDRHLYCFCRHDTYPEFTQALQQAGFKLKRTLIWIKNNHGSGDLTGDYAPQDEWIIFAQKGRRKLNGKRHSNILFYDKVPSKKLTHLTEKPVKLLKFLIQKSTLEGELVLDPYAGSGSTMHAAIEMQRGYCVIELSEEYYYTTEERKRDIEQIDFSDVLYGLNKKKTEKEEEG